MKRFAVAGLAVSIVLAAAGCLYGPRVNLARFGSIGLVEFRSEAKGRLGEYATDVFLEVLVRSQPGARIKPLGRVDEVLRDVGAPRLSPDALEAVRRRYGVDAILAGTLTVSDIRPRVDLAAIVSALSVSAVVDAALSVRLIDAGDGSVLWADSARDRQEVASVSVIQGGGFFFDARDPERAYGRLVRGLVGAVTRDLR